MLVGRLGRCSTTSTPSGHAAGKDVVAFLDVLVHQPKGDGLSRKIEEVA